MKIDGRFWLDKDGESFLGSGRIELLEQIERTGSIHAAAKAMKMSYKGAWERINQMNTLADKPIITKSTGGRGGGGSVLTPHAYELIATFRRFEELHRQFIERFAEAGDDPERLARILSRTFLTTSARNQLEAKVESIIEKGLRGTLRLRINDALMVDADITLKSIRSMGLERECDAYAIMKSSDVHVSATAPQNSEELNIVEGEVVSVERLEGNAEVTLRVGNATIVGVESEEVLLEQGMNAYALISKKHIIVGL